ncbi:FkbM family methyltransferase [Labrys sp. 22185]|uniref:FkbM family methyltransferase n=1 Tax=Labrys sp. 22185 TaxID=3453888 RepID=UPI003F83BA61
MTELQSMDDSVPDIIRNYIDRQLAASVGSLSKVDGMGGVIDDLARRLKALEGSYNRDDRDYVSQRVHSKFLRDRVLSLFQYLEPEDVIGSDCYVRLGKDFDGGYIFLKDGLKGKIAYSFGINNDVSWDRNVADLGYDVYMYDHTIPNLPEENVKFHFFKTGVSGKSSDTDLKTIENIILDNNHSELTDIILKMDIEGAEWEALSAVPEKTLRQFGQIALEYHWFDHLGQDEVFYPAERALRKMHKLFAPVHIHSNNCCDLVVIGGVPVPPVLEVTYVNRAAFKTEKSRRVFPTPLDQPNDPNRPDHHLGTFRFSEAR